MSKEALMDKVLNLLNGMIQRCEKTTYNEFNIKMKALNTKDLLEFEQKFTEVGVGGTNEELNISTLSIIATITDILIGERLAGMFDENQNLVGFCWYKKGNN